MKDLYKCPSCKATDYAEDLDEHEVGDGYVCNSCLDHIMILQQPVDNSGPHDQYYRLIDR